MLKDKAYLGFIILLFIVALLTLLVGTSSAQAATISPDGNAMQVGASEVGPSFRGTGVTPDVMGTLASSGVDTAFEAVSPGNGPQQILLGGFKDIDLCMSSSDCSGGNFQNGLHAEAMDMVPVILAAAFGRVSKATVTSFPIKFQTSDSSFEIAANVDVVPLPTMLPLLAAAIGGFVIVGRRRSAK